MTDTPDTPDPQPAPEPEPDDGRTWQEKRHGDTYPDADNPATDDDAEA